ncbi:MAG: hypothetical protein M1133_12670 [Armatimonadetes bacterium]|nr:hypothetical protein [Armatimonadota bacterium]
MHRSTKYLIVLLTAALVSSVSTKPAHSGSIATKVLTGAAVGFAVTKTAKPLDKFINTVTLRNGMQSRMATKVVPILSVGEKGYVGGAQVSGPAAVIDKVEAVFQYEKNFSNNNYRAKVLVPSASLNPLKLERVPKAGVTAIIDVALDGGLRYHTVGTPIRAGDVVRGAGLLVVVKNTGPAINKALNMITFNKGYSTKVVPMGSVGEKMYLGGAQISASTRTINAVNALWQYDDLFSNGRFRVKVLVPTTSSNPLKMKRVDGAGVTAVIDMALAQQEDLQRERKRERYPLGGILGGLERDRDEDRHDNGLHKGWYKGKHKGRKNPQVDEKWREKFEDKERD